MSMLICGIYKITSPIGRVYIGQSINIQRRFKTYKRIKGVENQRKLFYSFIKYGVENHQFEIIEECLRDNLTEREEFWIKELNTLSKNGLNLCYGKGSKHYKLSEWAKQVISNKNSKSVYQYDFYGNFIKEYPSAKTACSSLGINPTTLSQCANETRGIKQAGGFVWRKYKIDKIEPVIPHKAYLYGIKPQSERPKYKYVYPKKTQQEKEDKLMLKPLIIVTDQNNQIVAEGRGIKSLAKKLNIQSTNLGRVLNKKRKTANGYYAFYAQQ